MYNTYKYYANTYNFKVDNNKTDGVLILLKYLHQLSVDHYDYFSFSMSVRCSILLFYQPTV